MEAKSLKNTRKLNNIKIQSIKNSNKDINKNSVESPDNEKSNNKNDETNYIIENIYLKDLLISMCCCCERRKENMYKILIDESMNVITEKLDIYNIFRKICSIEYSNGDLNNNFNTIKMSDENSKNLSEIIKLVF